MSKLISIITPSRRPRQLQGLLESLRDTVIDYDSIEVIVKSDWDHIEAIEYINDQKGRWPFTIKSLFTPRLAGYVTLWVAAEEALPLTDPDSYFIWLVTDETRCETHGWDRKLAQYVGIYPDHVFRLRTSWLKFNNYYEPYMCLLMPDNFPIYTRNWLVGTEGFGDCTGSDAQQQLIAYYLGMGLKNYYELWRNEGYWRDIPIIDIEVSAGGEPGKDIGEQESMARMARNWHEHSRMMRHDKHVECNYYAIRLMLCILAHWHGLLRFRLVKREESRSVDLIDLDRGDVACTMSYDLPHWPIVFNRLFLQYRRWKRTWWEWRFQFAASLRDHNILVSIKHWMGISRPLDSRIFATRSDPASITPQERSRLTQATLDLIRGGRVRLCRAYLCALEPVRPSFAALGAACARVGGFPLRCINRLTTRSPAGLEEPNADRPFDWLGLKWLLFPFSIGARIGRAGYPLPNRDEIRTVPAFFEQLRSVMREAEFNYLADRQVERTILRGGPSHPQVGCGVSTTTFGRAGPDRTGADPTKKSKLISIITPSRRPHQLQGLLESLRDTVIDYDSIEVIVKLDWDHIEAIEYINDQGRRWPFTVKAVLTPRLAGLATLWIGIEECLAVTDPDSYFVWMVTDETRCETHGWDRILARYVGLYPDHIFRLRTSWLKFVNYYEPYMCLLMPDNFPIYTRNWFVGAEGFSDAPSDAHHQMIAYYLGMGAERYRELWRDEAYWRDIPVIDMEFSAGAEPGKDIGEEEIMVRLARNKREHGRMMHYNKHLEYNYCATKLLLALRAHWYGVFRFRFSTDEASRTVSLIDLDFDRIACSASYDLAHWPIFFNRLFLRYRRWRENWWESWDEWRHHVAASLRDHDLLIRAKFSLGVARPLDQRILATRPDPASGLHSIAVQTPGRLARAVPGFLRDGLVRLKLAGLCTVGLVRPISAALASAYAPGGRFSISSIKATSPCSPGLEEPKGDRPFAWFGFQWLLFPFSIAAQIGRAGYPLPHRDEIEAVPAFVERLRSKLRCAEFNYLSDRQAERTAIGRGP